MSSLNPSFNKRPCVFMRLQDNFKLINDHRDQRPRSIKKYINKKYVW